MCTCILSCLRTLETQYRHVREPVATSEYITESFIIVRDFQRTNNRKYADERIVLDRMNQSTYIHTQLRIASSCLALFLREGAGLGLMTSPAA